MKEARKKRKKKENMAHTILSAKLGSDLPPPPRPLRALNMPGQRKQTKATMPSWMRGEAYQLVENLPMEPALYIHPAGRGTGSADATGDLWSITGCASDE